MQFNMMEVIMDNNDMQQIIRALRMDTGMGIINQLIR